MTKSINTLNSVSAETKLENLKKIIFEKIMSWLFSWNIRILADSQAKKNQLKIQLKNQKT